MCVSRNHRKVKTTEASRLIPRKLEANPEVSIAIESTSKL